MKGTIIILVCVIVSAMLIITAECALPAAYIMPSKKTENKKDKQQSCEKGEKHETL